MKSKADVIENRAVRIRSRAMDYAELMKPELTLLSVLTTLSGVWLGTRGALDVRLMFAAAIGTLLVGGGAGALNQWMERGYDAEMKRTERRPLPSGRIRPGDALAFGLGISIAGVALVTFFINPLTGCLAVATLATYLLLYTPMKRLTKFNTILGGIPGALPAMAGWTAVRNDVGPEAWILFAILFFWQMPHFFSLAWMYRKDYARAGYRMMTFGDESGARTGRYIVWFCAALIPASIAPTMIGLAGYLYLGAAMLGGAAFMLYGLLFAEASSTFGVDAILRTNRYARKLFFASLLYLPFLMILMAIDKT